MDFTFGGQHHAKIHETNATHTTITFLDNASGPGVPEFTNEYSRGLIVQLDEVAMTAKIVSEYPHPDRTYAPSRGDMQILPNGNIWMCWSKDGLQTEHAANGTVLMKARFRAGISSYRTFKQPWIGRPTYPPDVHAAVVGKDGHWYTIVHVSWNGATEVKNWQIYRVDENSTETIVAKVPKRGFETSAWTEGYSSHVFIEALDRDGNKLGRSQVFASLPPRNHSQEASQIETPLDLPTYSADTAQISRLTALIDDSRATFVIGIALGILVSVLIWLMRKHLKMLSSEQKIQTYEPLTKGDIEEHMELGDYVDSEDETGSDSDAKRTS